MSDDVATDDFRVTRPFGERVEVEDVPLAADRERYESLGVLGKGGMGEVRLVRDKRIARQVAVKVLRAGLGEKSDYRSRFVLEARLQGQLEHPSIVPVHDLGETPDGELFFSMTRVRGMTLRSALTAVRRGDASPRLSRRRLLTAFSSVCLAVDFAHRRGVVHRDLKPENVMLGDFGEVYVLDWGIAKVMHADEAVLDSVELPPGSVSPSPTESGTVLGTQKYMSPERRQGQTDARSDVYSLGVILGEILENDEREVPPELSMITVRAMHLDPEERFATARDLHEALEQFLDGDRDLEARRKLSEDHARRAEDALAKGSRSEAGREIGRALGLDPDNAHAMRTLMRLVTEVPDPLPPAAEAQLEQSLRERRVRTMRASVPICLSPLAIVPFYLWLGVLDWTAVVLFTALIVAAGATQWYATRPIRPRHAMLAVPYVLHLAGFVVMAMGSGLLGALPGAFALHAIAWRMVVSRWVAGIAMLGLAGVAILAPFALASLGWISPSYVARSDGILVMPVMHALPPDKAIAAIIVCTWGLVWFALLWGRIYNTQARQQERILTFQAWQLQQLVSTEP